MTNRSIFRAAVIAITLAFGLIQPPTEATAQEVVRVSDGEQNTSLNIEVGRSVVLMSEKEFSELSVGIPEIADVSVISEKSVSVLARSPGRTDLTIFDPDGRLMSRLYLIVVPELNELRQRLGENFPNEQVTVSSAGTGIILSGRVSGTGAKADILALAGRYAPENVTDLLELGGEGGLQSEPAVTSYGGSDISSATVRVGSSTVVQVNRPFLELAVGSPETAQVTALSESSVQIAGRLPGKTDLTLIGGDGGVMSVVNITVVPDLTELRQRIRENFPTENVTVAPAGAGVILSGRVSGNVVIADMVALAGRYAPENVTNLLEVGLRSTSNDQQVVRTPGNRQISDVTVQVGRSSLIEVTRPFSELSVGSPDIAQVAALSDKSIQILGRVAGRTDLTILGGDGLAMSLVNIVVVPELSELQQRLDELLPNERIELRSAADGIVLSGKVSSASKIEAAVALAQRYAPEKVINLLSVGNTRTLAPGQSVVTTDRPVPFTDIKVNVGRSSVFEVEQAFTNLTVGVVEIAEVNRLSDRSVQIFGRSPGRTDLTIMGTDGLALAHIRITVEPNFAELKQRLQELLPGQPIEVRSVADGIALSGDVSGGAQITKAMELASRYAPGKVTNLMSVSGTQQVMLQVRFAEMQRSVSKRLGFNFGVTGQGGNATFSVLSGENIASGLLPAAETFGFVGLALNTGDAILTAFLDNLEQKGLIRTLAEPNLVALSGNSASFLAGGELPIPVASDVGDNGATISVTFKPFGVSLAFTPTVVDEDLINLDLKTEVSFIDETIEVDTGLISIPGLGVRRAETTVELRDGQSLAIAGLLQDDFNDNVRQFPWLADTPVIGSLLRSSDFQRRQTELVVLITPTIVTAVDSEQISLPTDRIQIPNEYELFMLGTIESPSSRPAALGLDGEFGYVIE